MNEVADAVVIFVHAEKSDEEADREVAVLRQTLKHIKWLANKRAIKNIVIHSFTHLGGETASLISPKPLLTLSRNVCAKPLI